MRKIFLASMLLMLTACAHKESDAVKVFEHAFGTGKPPVGVFAVDGYLLRRQLIVYHDEAWWLHINGPDAESFVEHRWPDLKLHNQVVFVDPGLPWFRASDNQNSTWWLSEADPNIQVLRRRDAPDIYLAYRTF